MANNFTDWLSYDCVGGSVSAVTFSTGTGGTLAGGAYMFTYSLFTGFYLMPTAVAIFTVYNVSISAPTDNCRCWRVSED